MNRMVILLATLLFALPASAMDWYVSPNSPFVSRTIEGTQCRYLRIDSTDSGYSPALKADKIVYSRIQYDSNIKSSGTPALATGKSCPDNSNTVTCSDYSADMDGNGIDEVVHLSTDITFTDTAPTAYFRVQITTPAVSPAAGMVVVCGSVSGPPQQSTETDPVFRAMNTEAELELQLGSLNVYTQNDGPLGGGGSGNTNLTTNRDSVSITVLSDTGTDVTLAAVTTSFAGVMTAADKVKLNGIQAGATNDDVPESGDFGAALGLEADGSISPGAVSIASLAATGTPSGSTFLRGDNVWATPAVGAAIALDQTGSESDLRYDTTVNCYYPDRDGSGTRNITSDGEREPCVDVSDDVWIEEFAAGSSTFGLQEAITHVCTTFGALPGSYGGVIRIRGTTYDFGTTTVSIPSGCHGLTIQGAGPHHRNNGKQPGTELVTNQSGSGFSFISVASSLERVKLVDLTIAAKLPGTNTVVVNVAAGTGQFTMERVLITAVDAVESPINDPDGIGLKMTDPVYPRITQSEFLGFGTGVLHTGTTGAGGSVYRENRFANSATGVGVGLQIGEASFACTNVHLIGNTIEGNFIGLYANLGSGPNCTIHLSHNHFEQVQTNSKDIVATGSSAINSSNNYYAPSSLRNFHRTQQYDSDAIDQFSGDQIYGVIEMTEGTCEVSNSPDMYAPTTNTTACGHGPLIANSITLAMMTDASVGIAELAATGTPDGTTFLRGDGNWAVPPGGGSGLANLFADPAPAVSANLDMNAHDITDAGLVDGRDVSADGAKIDAFSRPYDKIVEITDRETACATYTSAFEEYHDGTAAEGQYRVKVVFNLRGAEAIRPHNDFYDDSGNWPYKSCFIHHPADPGSFNGSFPDTIGRLAVDDQDSGGTVNHTGGIEVYVDLDGTIEIDKTSLAKNALLFDTGGSYLAGCDEGVDNNDLCGALHYGAMTGALRMRGNVNVEIITKNDGSWTGEGIPSMGPTARLSKEANSFFAVFSAHGNTYADLSELTINAYRLGHTDIIYDQVNSWGIQPPKLNCVVCEYGIGARFYGFANFTGVARDWSLKNMDHAILLGDPDNGGYTVMFSGCDAADKTNGTCGLAGSGVALGSVTTGVNIDGVMAEGGAQSYTTIMNPLLGAYNSIKNIYAEQTSDFTGVSVAIAPQFCSGTGTGTLKPKGTAVANDADCSVGGTSSAAPAPNATSAITNGIFDIGFAHSPSAVVAPAKTILLGDGCISDKLVRISGDRIYADSNGAEFVASTAIATSGGCKLSLNAPPRDGQFPSYYNRIDAWENESIAKAEYFCEKYPGADIGAQCNAAFAALKADGKKGGKLVLGNSNYSQTTNIDVCEEGTGNYTSVSIVGQGRGVNGSKGGTILTAAAGFASANVSKTSFTIGQDDGPGGRDRIACVGCQFVTLGGIRRGDLIETTGWASSNNNYNRLSADATRQFPLKVYSATDTEIVVENESSINAGLTAVGPTATGDVRRLKAQIETCTTAQDVAGIQFDGNDYADIGIHHRPDNNPAHGCTDGSTPWALCDSLGLGSVPIDNSVGNAIEKILSREHKYYDVALTSLEASGQSDHFVIRDSHLGAESVGGFWYDSLQAQPGPLVQNTQIEAFKRFGALASSGTLTIDNSTVISAHANCIADTYGASAHVELRTANTLGLHILGSNIEAKCGTAIKIGSVTNQIRGLTLIGNFISANAPGETTMSLLDAPGFCGNIVNTSTWAGQTGPAAPVLTIGNSNHQTCATVINGRGSYRNAGTAAPALTVNDGIPVSMFSDSLIGDLGTPNNGGLVDWTQLVNVPAGFADETDGGSAIVFDLGDDGGNDSVSIAEIAIVGDTNGIFSEPSADKMRINLAADWPKADQADSLAANGTNCPGGSYPLGVNGVGAAEACTVDDDIPESGDFGAATDIDAAGAVRGNAVALGTDTTGGYAASSTEGGPATTATALAANGGNCSAGNFPLGVDASGATEGCTDVVIPSEVSAYTVSGLSPVDGTALCTVGDMWLNEVLNQIFYCVDSATDDWFGVQLVDAP